MTVLGVVNQTARIMLSVTLTPMLIIYLGFIGSFSILRRSLHPIGYLAPSAGTLSSTFTRLLSIIDCNLKLFYFSLQLKRWFLYLGVSLELELDLKLAFDLVLLDLCLIHKIILVQIQCAIVFKFSRISM